ncbi:unnamed protein product [Dicrocoelium dendriticum]|nr:unnamed protein product [Dicrocoelium dendriticum]
MSAISEFCHRLSHIAFLGSRLHICVGSDLNRQRKTRSSDLESTSNSIFRSILCPLDTNLYLPSPNLEPRKKPVSLSPTAPRLIYQLPEEDIRADVEAIMAAVKEHKIAVAMAEMNRGKQVC